MKREDLKKLELSDEAIDAIMALHGKGIATSKAEAEAATAQVDALTSQLTKANEAVEGFKALDPAGLQKAVDDYKLAAEKAKTDAELQVAALKFDHALEGELKLARVKDPADVIPHLKRDMLKLGEDGKLIGLKEQLTPLQESKSYLFDLDEEEGTEEEEEEPQIVLGGHSRSVIGDSIAEAARKGAGLKSDA
jgi:hypothetical protein